MIQSMFLAGFSFEKVWEAVSDPFSTTRNGLISIKDVRAIQDNIEKKRYTYHPNDYLSVSVWIQNLTYDGHVVDFHSDGKNFRLGIMTDLGRFAAKSFPRVVCLDSTHKTTQYGYSLYSLIAQNDFGNGIPVSFLITSGESAACIRPWLSALKDQGIQFGCVMTDNDDAEIDVVKSVFPESTHLLCWWHVLKNWKTNMRSKLEAPKHDTVFSKLKNLLMKSVDFDSDFGTVCELSNGDFSDYLKREWLPKKEKWAYQFRIGVKMYKTTNTNMLIESFHNILKTQFLNGKKNRRIDKLIYILTGPLQKHYLLKQRRNVLGFSGPNLEAMFLKSQDEKAKEILKHDINETESGHFLVKSSSLPGSFYKVDLNQGHCDCLIFLKHDYCKHLIACSNLKIATDGMNVSEVLPQPVAVNQLEAIVSPKATQKSNTTDVIEQLSSSLNDLKVSELSSLQLELLHHALKIVNAARNVISVSRPAPEVAPPNQLYSNITVHPFKVKKAKGRPKVPQTSILN